MNDTESYKDRIEDIIKNKNKYKRAVKNYKYNNDKIITKWNNVFNNKNIITKFYCFRNKKMNKL